MAMKIEAYQHRHGVKNQWRSKKKQRKMKEHQ